MHTISYKNKAPKKEKGSKISSLFLKRETWEACSFCVNSLFPSPYIKFIQPTQKKRGKLIKGN